MAIAVLINLGIVIAYHAWLLTKFYDSSATHEYTWGDYAVIISSVVLLPAYLYSIWGKKSLVSNKYSRAVLMLLPALFLISVQLREVDIHLIMLKIYTSGDSPEQSSEFSIPSHEYRPFSCTGYGGRVDGLCWR